jgi:putative oxidoreductase
MDLAAVRAAATPYALALLRIMTGLLFFEHGSAKLIGIPSLPGAGGGGWHAFTVFTGTIELVGGALIVAGLFTAVVAFILSGYMAVAYFWAHFPASFFPLVNHGESAIFFCFVFLFLAAAGPGAWAVDGARAGPLPTGRRGDLSPKVGR